MGFNQNRMFYGGMMVSFNFKLMKLPQIICTFLHDSQFHESFVKVCEKHLHFFLHIYIFAYFALSTFLGGDCTGKVLYY